MPSVLLRASVDGASRRGGVVSRALNYVEEHLHEPLVVGSVAAAAGVGERALQVAFRRELGRTPVSVIRERRLAVAQVRLRAADPSVTTVTQVASSVGWSHLGRFAVEYRRRFGESPGVTLRS